MRSEAPAAHVPVRAIAVMPPDPLDRFQCKGCGEHFVVPSLARDHEAAHAESTNR